MKFEYDAVIIGSGPNGLAAAITLARAGWKVVVFEAAAEIGGGLRSAELTLPGFCHDVCSTVYPLVPVSPFFRQLSDAGITMELIQPEIPLAHVVVGDQAVAVHADLEQTVAGLGADGDAYRKLLEPFLRSPRQLFDGILAPPFKPRDPLPLCRFGWRGFRSAESLANHWFQGTATKGMFAGMAAHSVLPMDRWLTGAVGLMFCITAHATGWPIARKGAESIAKTLATHLETLGGTIETSCNVTALTELPASQVVLFDTSPSQMLKIADDELPSGYRKALNKFQHGPGICKVDWALNGPIPWSAEICRRAGTVHIGGSMDAIKQSEQAVWDGHLSSNPFVLVTQPSLFDSSRAHAGKHVAWAYCHVPHGCAVDHSAVVEQRIETAAPGFRDVIIGKHVICATELQTYNSNYIGGDISGGAMNLRQFIARPVLRTDPYSTPNPRLFLCSSSTPPGPGVHGMCGHFAAQSVLARHTRGRQQASMK